MTAAVAADAPPASKMRWDAIDWRAVHNEVRRLQVRIAKAVGTVVTAYPTSGSPLGDLCKCLSRMTGNCHVRF